VTVSSGAATYPEDVADRLRRAFPRLVYFDAGKRAEDLGNVRAANIVLLGALSRGLDLPLEAWEEAIGASVKEKQRDLNLRAFEIGKNVR
jgi:indolepyruvate ferredoxin oxidoreductase beta subunit